LKIMTLSERTELWTQLRQQLEQQGHQVVHSESCRLGYKAIVSDSSIDLVILDGDASDDCGLAMIARCRADQRSRWVPIIAAGSRFEASAVEQYMVLGVQDILTLPVASETLEAKLASAEKAGKPTILVVDDEPAIRDLLREFLELERFRAICAESAEQALKILSSEDVHVVVTDVVMSGISGMDLMLKVKERYPRMPVILITGYASGFSPSEAIEAGADGYFAKPFHNMELAYTLRSVLQRRPRPLAKPVGEPTDAEKQREPTG